MSEWVYDCWNSVMDHEKNPLSAIPDAIAITVTTFETAKRKPNVFGAYSGRGNGGEHE